jgi:hypothetical protein
MRLWLALSHHRADWVVLCCSEYKDREAQYYWILKEQQKVWPGLPHVHMWDYSR